MTTKKNYKMCYRVVDVSTVLNSPDVKIKRDTFVRYANSISLRELESELGYCQYPFQGLTMGQDKYVSYYTGWYHGDHCIYFTRNDIAYVFVD